MKNKILISEGIKIKIKEIKKEDTKNKFLNNYEKKKTWVADGFLRNKILQGKKSKRERNAIV